MRIGILCIGSMALLLAATAAPAGERSGVDETVEAISRKLEGQGFEIQGVVNHGAAAASVGLELPPTQVLFFGSPRTEASLIRRSQTAALDLPLRFLVWEDASGENRIDTNDVGFLVDRHALPIFDFRLFLLGGVLSQFGEAETGIVRVESERGMDETVGALLLELTERGFRIPFVIDYAARAKQARRRVRPTTLVMFGNPAVGTPLMQASRGIGLDLPQKMLVYRDRQGRVQLAYNDPFFLASKHDVVGQDPRLGNIAAALRAIAVAAAGAP